MTPKQISAFASYVRESAEQIVSTLQEYGLINPTSRELDEVVVRQLLTQPPEEGRREIGHLIDVAPTLGARYEYLGEFDKARVYYRLGLNKWPHPWPQHPNNVGEDSFGSRRALGDAQLQAAVCADRVGEKQRAAALYEWAAGHLILKPEELDYFAHTEQYQAVWEWLPYRAYALTCLEKWEEALTVAEEAAHWVERDKRALMVESYQTPLKILPVVLALARCKVAPTEANRTKAQEMLNPQAVATRNHSSHLTALFYLYNLRAWHPELIREPATAAWPAGEAGPKLQRELPHPASIRSLTFSPDSRLLAVGLGNGGVWLWQADDWTVRLQWDAHPNTVRSLAFSPDGRRLATGANRAYASSEPTLRLWQVDNAAMLYGLAGHSESVTGVAFAPNGTALASASDDGTVRLWGVNDGLERKKWEVHNRFKILLSTVTFSPDGRWLAAGGGFHGQIWLWDMKREELQQVLEEHKEEECSTPELEGEIAEHDVLCLAFAPDGELLAAGTFDGGVQIWRVGDGKLVRRLEGHNYDLVESIAVAPDGSTVVSAGDKRVQGWRLEDGAPVWMEELSTSVHGLAFAPDGRWLAAGAEDGVVRIWGAV